MRRNEQARAGRPSPGFLTGEGEMVALIRSKDWSRTPLGPIENWPQSLRTTVSLCLASNFPINIIWGAGHTQIYNDGYRVVCGEVHPRALGEAYTETWASAWPAVGPPFERALAGETSFLENQRMFLFRNGYLEETFFTFSLSPIREESGAIGGLFHPVAETTAAMLAERRTRLLRDLNARIADARSTEEVFHSALAVLAEFPLDLPFVGFYRLSPDGESFDFVGQTGCHAGAPLLPQVLSVGDADPWPLPEILTASAPFFVTGLREKLLGTSCGPYEEAPDAAFVLPIVALGRKAPVALAITGASARLPLDQGYRDFFGLLSAATAAGFAHARAYEEEQARVEALAQIDRAKTAFFSNVSHEFRTPLTLLIGPIEDALDDFVAGLPEIQRGRIDMARRNGLRLLKLVNALLDFARIEAGRAQASFEPVDLAAATSELAGHFRSACEMAGLSLTVDCPPLGQPVFVDRDMWEKIVLNLLSNAFKFTMTGGIDVELRMASNRAQLTVRDTGTGIAAEEIPRLFERFHRVAGSQGRTYEGTGIGLALVQELVALHGGSIWADSAPGLGSAFHVSLPLGDSHLPAEQIRVAPQLAGTAVRAEVFVEEALRWLPDSPERACREHTTVAGMIDPFGDQDRPPLVLLADDNSDMRDYVSRILAAAGCAVTLAADGEAALAAIRGPICPDLIVSDVMMPRLDGFGLLKALRADPAIAGVPLILLSARAGEEARLEGLAAGADDYVVKPFSGRELVARVEGALRLARLRREKADAERRIVERALDLTEDRLSLALDSARMGSWDWDLETDTLEWNPTCRAIFGVGADRQMTFAIFLELLVPEDRERIVALCGQVLDPAVRAPYDAEYRVLWPDGSIHWILARGKAYFFRGRAVRFIGAVIDVTRQKEAEIHLRVMVNELSHRVKNTLAVVQSITEQTFRSGAALGDVRQDLAGRLQALADTHTLLTQSNWQSVDLASLIGRCVGHLVPERDARFRSEGPEVGLKPKAALALGLVVHELGVNAMKHGAWSVDGGMVTCRWSVMDGHIRIEWSETGMTGLEPPARRGFGSQLINQAIAYDIAGEARLTWRPEGLLYELKAPVGSGLS